MVLIVNFVIIMQIKKFKDALGRYGTDRCSLGPAKGLDESELLALASVGQLSRNELAIDYPVKKGFGEFVLSGLDLSDSNNNLGLKERSKLLMA